MEEFTGVCAFWAPKCTSNAKDLISVMKNAQNTVVDSNNLEPATDLTVCI